MEEILEIFCKRLSEVKHLVQKTNKCSVLIIQQFPIESTRLAQIPFVRESISNILAFVELGTVEILEEIIKSADEAFDYVLFDSDVKIKESEALIEYSKNEINGTKIFYYSDINTWSDSALTFLNQISGGIYGSNIYLAGVGLLYENIRIKLTQQNARLSDGSENADAIIGASMKEQSIGVECLGMVGPKTKVFDVGINNFSPEFIEGAREIGAMLYRIDIRAGISSLVLGILETEYLIENVLGTTKIKGIELVGGGAMGTNGAVIVDDIKSPSHIIGIADGKGNIKESISDSERANIKFIDQLINPDNDTNI